jgi:YlmC/YmxH family sporulation protein
MLLNFVDLKQKEIINIVDGKKLGYPDDIVFDSENTSVKSFTIPGQSRAFGLKKGESRTIKLEDIFLIGEDVILVNIPTLVAKKSNDPKNEFMYIPKHFKKINK